MSQSKRPYDDHRHTRLWRAVEESLKELVATREIDVNTALDYVVGHLCQELTAKKVIASDAFGPRS